MTTEQLLINTLPTHLIQHAELLSDSGNYPEALAVYDQIIAKTSPNAFLYQQRGLLKRFTEDYQGGIHDLDQAIALSPDDAEIYIQRAACRSHGLSSMSKVNRNTQKQWLHKITADYRSSLERDPSSENAWLATIETYLLLHDWDAAIGIYGLCQPYITSRSLQLVRAWLGCLAMCLCDDDINSEDKAPLLDDTIHLYRMDWCIAEIDFLLNDLAKLTPACEGLDTALELHRLFLGHFKEVPFR